MKFNAISGSSLGGEGKKSSLTIYADLDITDKNKVPSPMETEVSTLKKELLQAQNALKKQTRRCRQLVEEFTRTLQEKDFQYEHEKHLRDDQLAKVLRALLLVEARLKQEQKLIKHQLRERDFIIEKQCNDLKKILSSQYCSNCSRYYNTSQNLESLDSSSECMRTDYESNFGSLDSSSELYATFSDKDSSSNRSNTLDDSGSNGSKSTESGTKFHRNNKGSNSIERKIKKFPHRKSVGMYFEVLKIRQDNISPYSNEDNTSNDYDNFDSLPPESIISYDVNSNNDNDFETTNNLSLSESNITVIHNTTINNATSIDTETTMEKEVIADESKECTENSFIENKLSNCIPVFDVEGESNDTWYVSASDQEDEQHKNIYTNNPVLECVNQILLQNISDTINSPPKTPNLERKLTKNKRVKFSDEETLISEKEIPQNEDNVDDHIDHDYYETPIQNVPNFYESPQSIYSNDYEQILNECSETFSPGCNMALKKNLNEEKVIQIKESIVRKNKILRTPPALPPKPSNLLSKYKIHGNSLKFFNEKQSDANSLESEPDYCSISELNLPTDKLTSKKIQVIAEINGPTSKNIGASIEQANDIQDQICESNDYDSVNSENNNMIMKNIEKVNIQIAKQTSITSEDLNSGLTSPIKLDIPKLPQVSEILIPEDTFEKEEMISQDNYVKNNSQILKNNNSTPNRKGINIGSSVSSLIMGFNNRELMYEINKKTVKLSPPKKLNTLDNSESKNKQSTPALETENATYEDFNLNQNFEEFKLDDCEFEEYVVPDSDNKHEERTIFDHSVKDAIEEMNTQYDNISVPALNRKSLELLKQQLQKQKNIEQSIGETGRFKSDNEPTYEHFLECTGLSSKSILTPARMITNHKTVLKPKDIKLRSKTKSCNIKYWSEPFI